MIMIKEENSYILYFDFNNEYGWASSELSPYDRFEYVKYI